VPEAASRHAVATCPNIASHAAQAALGIVPVIVYVLMLHGGVLETSCRKNLRLLRNSD